MTTFIINDFELVLPIQIWGSSRMYKFTFENREVLFSGTLTEGLKAYCISGDIEEIRPESKEEIFGLLNILTHFSNKTDPNDPGLISFECLYDRMADYARTYIHGLCNAFNICVNKTMVGTFSKADIPYLRKVLGHFGRSYQEETNISLIMFRLIESIINNDDLPGMTCFKYKEVRISGHLRFILSRKLNPLLAPTD